MMITDFNVFITKNGDGAITYSFCNKKYKVFISKEDPVIKDIFDYFYNLLPTFKHRHYAIAKWIVRDIRNRGYVFKAYANNCYNIRPILIKQPKDNNTIELALRKLKNEDYLNYLDSSNNQHYLLQKKEVFKKC